MKRNESILVYSVTGLLVVILGVAIAFGDGGLQAAGPSNAKSFEELANLMPEASGAGGANPAQEPASDPAEQGESAPVPPAVEGPVPGAALNATAAPPPPPDAATRVLVQLGESTRDGDFRVVPVRHGDSFSVLVQRWCGGLEQRDFAASLNEEFDLQRLEPGMKLYLPWVDDETLLAAHEQRKAVRAQPAPAEATAAAAAGGSTEAYKVKAGDMLWNLAVARVGAGKASKFIETVRALNPELRDDPNRLVVGKTILLPR